LSLEVRVREVYETFHDKFPDSRVLIRVDGASTEDEVKAFVEMLSKGSEHVDENYQAVVRGHAPVSALAAAANKDVGTICSQLRPLPLGFSEPLLDDLEREGALSAVGRPAVWDTTSLFIIGGLGSELAELTRNVLTGSLIAQATLDDADAGAHEIAPGDGRHELMPKRLRISDQREAWQALVQPVAYRAEHSSPPPPTHQGPPASGRGRQARKGRIRRRRH
jgi:hypothetical protein